MRYGGINGLFERRNTLRIADLVHRGITKVFPQVCSVRIGGERLLKRVGCRRILPGIAQSVAQSGLTGRSIVHTQGLPVRRYGLRRALETAQQVALPGKKRSVLFQA